MVAIGAPVISAHTLDYSGKIPVQTPTINDAAPRGNGNGRLDVGDLASQVVLLGEAVDTITAGTFRQLRPRLAETAYAALAELRLQHPDEESKTARNRHIVAAIDQVKQALGNTRAVCRKCYVHPAILEAYFAGETIPCRTPGTKERRGSHRTAAERALLAFLRGRRAKPSRAKAA